MNLTDLSMIIVAIGALSVAVNIITEVIKKVLNKKTEHEYPIPIIVLILSVLITMFSFAAYELYNGQKLTWYSIGASFFAGFFVAYSAMFGYDKLKKTISEFKK